MPFRPVHLLLLLGVLLFAACDAATTAPVDEGDSDVLAEAPPSEGTTLSDLAEEASEADEPEFTILVEALKAAGLYEVLDGNRAFTVFAPTDEAFTELAALLGLSPEELLADDELLREVLLYHVVPGKRDAEEVLDSDEIRTQQGGFIFPLVIGDDAFIVDGSDDTGNAKIVTPDIEASNGILHVIDAVLLPGPGSEPGDDDDEDDDRDGPTLAELVGEFASQEGEEAQFTLLLAALEAADLVDALDGNGQLTVFAPTDAAFESLLGNSELLAELGTTADDLLADPELLREVLLHHVARGRRYAEDVLDSDQIRTLQGDFIFPVVVDEDAFIVDGTEATADAEIIESDVEARNGIIHVISEVLVPGPGSTPGGHDDDDEEGDEDDEEEDEGEDDDEEGEEEEDGDEGEEEEEDEDEGEEEEDEEEGEDEDDDEENENELTLSELLGAAADGDEPRFTVLRDLIEAAGLADSFSRKGQLTVFAPTDAAFETLLGNSELLSELGTTAGELLDDTELLQELLLHHVARGRRYSEDVLDSDQIRTLQGDFIFPVVEGENAFMVDGTEATDDAPIIETDIEASNGIIHVIDEVLVPGPGSRPGGHDDDEEEEEDEEEEDDGNGA